MLRLLLHSSLLAALAVIAGQAILLSPATAQDSDDIPLELPSVIVDEPHNPLDGQGDVNTYFQGDDEADDAEAETVDSPDEPPAYLPHPPSEHFYNYYVNGAGSMPATLYQAPRPVPPNVGHVYYTYQPFYPHEYLYPHYRVHVTHQGGNYYNGHGAVNETSVVYQRGVIRPSVPFPFLPRWRGGRHQQCTCPRCR